MPQRRKRFASAILSIGKTVFGLVKTISTISSLATSNRKAKDGRLQNDMEKIQKELQTANELTESQINIFKEIVNGLGDIAKRLDDISEHIRFAFKISVNNFQIDFKCRKRNSGSYGFIHRHTKTITSSYLDIAGKESFKDIDLESAR